MTCKTIRDEAISTFYSLNALDIVVQSYSPGLPMLAARKSVALSERYDHGVEKLHLVDVGPPRWSNLVLWLRLYHESDRECVVLNWNPCYGNRWDPTHSNRYKEKLFVIGLFEMVAEMRDNHWEDVENIITLLRSGLVQFDPSWMMS
jgi:hypothetical protein